MSGNHDILSEALTPAAVAAKLSEAGISISERTLRERARALGACRIIGKTMFLMPSDVETILEAAKPTPRVHPSPVTHWTDADTDVLLQRLQKGKTNRARLGSAPTGDYARLVAFREKQAKDAGRKK